MREERKEEGTDRGKGNIGTNTKTRNKRRKERNMKGKGICI